MESSLCIVAKKHALTPEEMILQDEKDWPGGCMVGFSLWIEEELRALCRFHNIEKCDLREFSLPGQDMHKVFDNWLEARNG